MIIYLTLVDQLNSVSFICGITGMKCIEFMLCNNVYAQIGVEGG